MAEQELVARLMQKSLRCRTGILLVDRRYLGKEGDIAARSGMQGLDAAAFFAESLPKEARFIDATVSSLFDLFDNLGRRAEGGDCMLVYNLDLLLSKLNVQDRLQLWRNLKDNMPYRQRALVFLMPTKAKHLLPTEDEMLDWENSSRLARMP